MYFETRLFILYPGIMVRKPGWKSHLGRWKSDAMEPNATPSRTPPTQNIASRSWGQPLMQASFGPQFGVGDVWLVLA